MSSRILIVDDQRDISRMLRSALETIESGVKVSEAPSGEEALLEVGRVPIDLLVTDYRLPGITGVELVRKFRARLPEIKIFMISGTSDERALKEIRDASPDAFFGKPVEISDFLAAVERTLGLARTVFDKTEAAQAPARVVEEKPGIDDLLIGLRKELQAQAVILLNDAGQVQSQAGEFLPANTNPSVVSALFSIFTSGQKAASLLEYSRGHFHIFPGERVDGVLCSTGSSNALFLAVDLMRDLPALSARLAVLFSYRDKIAEAIEESAPVAPFVIEPAVEQTPQAVEQAVLEEVPEDFMDILSNLGSAGSDASSFWDTVVENGTTFSQPDKLSYEQAQRLGLTPNPLDPEQ